MTILNNLVTQPSLQNTTWAFSAAVGEKADVASC